MIMFYFIIYGKIFCGQVSVYELGGVQWGNCHLVLIWRFLVEWRLRCLWHSKKSWSKYPYFRIMKELEVSLGEIALSTCCKNQIFKIVNLYRVRMKKKIFLIQDTCPCFRTIALEALLRRALCVVAHFCFLPMTLWETWECCVILRWFWFTLPCTERCSCPTKHSCHQSSNSTATPARLLLSPRG